ncbi:MAG: hypothetical protein JWP81_5315 [Ferruginibacter sp.]|nr:hypothetical protein [Ferruginibacter sp.]
MTKQLSNHRSARIARNLLVFPVAYCVLAAVLNYGLGFPLFLDLLEPVFEPAAHKHPRWDHQRVNFIQPVSGIRLELFLRCSNEMAY